MTVASPLLLDFFEEDNSLFNPVPDADDCDIDRDGGEDCCVKCLECHPLCITCNGPEPIHCLICNSNLGATYDFEGCSCPSHHYYDAAVKFCLECNVLCKECILGSSSTDCTLCARTAFEILPAHNGVVECVSFCDINKYYPDGRTCKRTLIHLMN